MKNRGNKEAQNHRNDSHLDLSTASLHFLGLYGTVDRKPDAVYWMTALQHLKANKFNSPIKLTIIKLDHIGGQSPICLPYFSELTLIVKNGNFVLKVVRSKE